MSENIALRLREVPMPASYFDYYSKISSEVFTVFEKAAAAKATLSDSSGMVEPKIAFDLSDRVSKMHDIDVTENLRRLIQTTTKELAALKLAEEIAQGKYSGPEMGLQEKLDLAVRVALAIVTEGVTIAPLQGISEVKIKKNADGSEYLSVSFAGPIRSAGGTEAASTMLIADHVRKIAGLGKYKANSYDDETGRFVEELRLYEREVGNFQFHVPDEDVVTVISNLSVEIDGIDTDPVEIVSHRNMARITTNRVRGGALRVLNDGLIGRSRKLLKLIELFNLDGWDWLKDLKGAIQTGDEDAAAHRMREVITGRSVLSMPRKLGGFRLRYGRACNTGFASIGIHPVVAEILDHVISVGTQIKLDIPGKASTVAFVDSVDTPVVRLDDGSVVKIRDTHHGIQLKPRITKILHLGDILISYGDFLENNAELVPSGYVEEFWAEELREKVAKYEPSDSELLSYADRVPPLDEAFKISLNFGIGLHPHYLYYWDQLTVGELERLLAPARAEHDIVEYQKDAKELLEKLGVPHMVAGDLLVLKEDEAAVFYNLLFRKPVIIEKDLSVPDIISRSSGIRIMPKFSTAIGVRVGRPEKASLRKMKPPVHTLFPVGGKGGASRDLLKAAKQPSFYCNIYNRTCRNCNLPSISIICPRCKAKTSTRFVCPKCRQELGESRCPKCKIRASAHSYQAFPIKELLYSAQERTGIRAQEPFKGVKELINQDRVAEPMEKGLIRQSLNLNVFKDGTIRFDATNAPISHFKPAWIGTTPERLVELGYTHDIDGRPLASPDQMVELKIQDVIIPKECGDNLVLVCQYIDKELEKLFGHPPYYQIRDAAGLVGHLIIGLAPHTSVGIVGRIIGYTDTQVCLGTAVWHSAKRRDADGDADSIMLLMDSLLNFSRLFLSDRIGGLMDAPLLVQPIVIPQEVQRQAHNFEVVTRYPLSFFQATLQRAKASEIKDVEILKSRLETERQFYGYGFTNITSTLTTSKSRSAYSTLGSVLEKLDMQIRTADIINAVDPSEVVSMVMTTHLLPDIMGNLRAYSGQSFRCTSCGASFRRIPLAGKCLECGNKLIQTMTRPSVQKYLKLARRMLGKYNIEPYLRGRVLALLDELELVFGKEEGSQALLTDYA
ncbi:MAG: DNA polymerase II large subunit [Thaumarchaeota archaeon]|nr:DNA polymerase II large subunit [Nitrososphaerota archaeon]